MSIYGVTSAAQKFCPIFPKNKKRRSRNYLISVPTPNPVPIPDCWFPNFPENLNFRLSQFPSYPISISFPDPSFMFPDNLMSSVVSNSRSYFYANSSLLIFQTIYVFGAQISVPIPNSGFLIFQTILVVVVATILRDPAVVFLQSARNQQQETSSSAFHMSPHVCGFSNFPIFFAVFSTFHEKKFI